MKIKIITCVAVSVMVCTCSSTNQCKVHKQEQISLQQKLDEKAVNDTPVNSYNYALK